MWKQWMVAGGLAFSVALASAQPYRAGLRSFELPYHADRIEATVWYPSEGAETTENFGPYPVHAAVGGTPADGRFALVLISHGTGGTRMNHHPLAEALARGGFVVAALTHPGDNYRDRSRSSRRSRRRSRPHSARSPSTRRVSIGRRSRPSWPARRSSSSSARSSPDHAC